MRECGHTEAEIAITRVQGDHRKGEIRYRQKERRVNRKRRRIQKTRSMV